MAEIDYIDFNYPVRDVRIEPGTRLWGYKDPRVSPLLTTFFCIPERRRRFSASTAPAR
jgi:hypothetical protein